MKIRNIAIIAHVDHGKTTLVDRLLAETGTFRENQEVDNRVMDSNDLEKERGITILAKATSIMYKDHKINIMDTPGHADFGGEVERIMSMVDGCLLLVDAFEGTMPQTRFVLKKALEADVKPIVVINKIDRENINISEIEDKVLELFIELGAKEEYCDFKIIYASALKNTSSLEADLNTQKEGMSNILDVIIDEIRSPKVTEDGPLLFQPTLLDYNDFVGRMGIGVIKRGKVRVGETVSIVRLDDSVKQFKILKLFGYEGIRKVELQEAKAGNIVSIAGLNDIYVGETVCDSKHITKLEPIKIDEPTLQMTFAVNNSPFSGLDGKHVTARVIEERLFKEVQKDVALKVERVQNSESWIVSGRGELHLSILMENMKREGYEIQVSKPEVITKVIDGNLCEPFEDLVVEVPNDYVGDIIDSISRRDGTMISMDTQETTTKFVYDIPSRGLIGFITNFLTLTKGYGVIAHTFKDYRLISAKEVGERQIGVLVATERGTATAYAIERVESHGVMFIEPGTEVYEGMIVGEHRYKNDLCINVCERKKQSNVRSAGKDNTVVLKSPRKMSIEGCLDYINSDELVEITPTTFRMRKKILNTSERKKIESRKKWDNINQN